MPSPKSILTVIALVTALALCPACGESDQASTKLSILEFRKHLVDIDMSYDDSSRAACVGYSSDKHNYESIKLKQEPIKKRSSMFGEPAYRYIENKSVLLGMFYQRSGTKGIASLSDSLCKEVYAITKKHTRTKLLHISVYFREQGPVTLQQLQNSYANGKKLNLGQRLGIITFADLDQARQCANADEYSAKMSNLVSANIRVAFNGLRVFKDY